jgi:DNA-binding beta-propeller fold protein YncE
VLVAAALVLVCVLAAGAFLGTRGSSGGLAEVRPNHVGVIDPKTNEITDEVQVGIRPGPLATDRGAVWAGNLQDRSLTRIDPRERSPKATVSLDNRTPTGIAVGAGGVWVANSIASTLTRIDPETNQPAGLPIKVATNPYAVDIAGDDVWVTSPAAGQVQRLSP